MPEYQWVHPGVDVGQELVEPGSGGGGEGAVGPGDVLM